MLDSTLQQGYTLIWILCDVTRVCIKIFVLRIHFLNFLQYKSYLFFFLSDLQIMQIRPTFFKLFRHMSYQIFLGQFKNKKVVCVGNVTNHNHKPLIRLTSNFPSAGITITEAGENLGPRIWACTSMWRVQRNNVTPHSKFCLGFDSGHLVQNAIWPILHSRLPSCPSKMITISEEEKMSSLCILSQNRLKFKQAFTKRIFFTYLFH